MYASGSLLAAYIRHLTRHGMNRQFSFCFTCRRRRHLDVWVGERKQEIQSRSGESRGGEVGEGGGGNSIGEVGNLRLGAT